MGGLDEILRLVASAAWVIFAIFALIFFIRNVLQYGFFNATLRLLSVRVLLPLFVVIVINFISAALVFVLPTQVGIVISYISPGGIRPQPLRAGLHLIVPILERELKYPIYWQTYTMSNLTKDGHKLGDDSIRARTSDGQEVRLDSSVIFRIDQEQAVTIHIDWQERYIEDFVRPVIRGFVRTQVSQFTVKEVNSSARKDLETTLDRLLREELASKGIIMDQFLLRDVSFTPQYAAAVEEKQVALEGKERTEHQAQQVRNLAEGERDRLRTEAEGERDRLMTEAEGRKEQFVLEAEGRAQAILLEAEAQAEALKLISVALAQNPDLLTYEYINKLSPNIRAMLVPNNAPLILPLQELVQELDMAEPMTQTLSTTDTPTTTVQPTN